MKSIDLMDLYLQINKAEQNINYLRKNLTDLRHTLRDMDLDCNFIALQEHASNLTQLEVRLEHIKATNKPF
jgi:hypothetical protein